MRMLLGSLCFVLPLLLGLPIMLPLAGALMQPVDPADDLALMLRQRWRWTLQHPILATRRARRRTAIEG